MLEQIRWEIIQKNIQQSANNALLPILSIIILIKINQFYGHSDSILETRENNCFLTSEDIEK